MGCSSMRLIFDVLLSNGSIKVLLRCFHINNFELISMLIENYMSIFSGNVFTQYITNIFNVRGTFCSILAEGELTTYFFSKSVLT